MIISANIPTGFVLIFIIIAFIGVRVFELCAEDLAYYAAFADFQRLAAGGDFAPVQHRDNIRKGKRQRQVVQYGGDALTLAHQFTEIFHKA